MGSWPRDRRKRVAGRPRPPWFVFGGQRRSLSAPDRRAGLHPPHSSAAPAPSSSCESRCHCPNRHHSRRCRCVLRRLSPRESARVQVGAWSQNWPHPAPLLSQLPAVLPRDTDRMRPLLRKTRVIHNPETPVLQLQRRACPSAHRPEHRLIRLFRLRYQMMQRRCLALTRHGSVCAVSGSTLLRSIGNINPRL